MLDSIYSHPDKNLDSFYFFPSTPCDYFPRAERKVVIAAIPAAVMVVVLVVTFEHVICSSQCTKHFMSVI